MKDLKYIIGSLVIHGMLFSSLFIKWGFKEKQEYMDSDVLLMGDGHGKKINPPKPKSDEKKEKVATDPDALKTYDKNASDSSEDSDSNEEAFGQGGKKALPYDTELTAWLQVNKRYPKMARRLGQECDNITLEFNVNPDGRLTDILIKEKCEFEVLNQAAVDMIKESSPFKPFPSHFPQKPLKRTQSFSYKLTE